MLVVVSACPMDLNPINATMGDIGLVNYTFTCRGAPETRGA